MSNDIKALSIKQPWAWLIKSGYKDIENRSWKTNYRGWFWIHTGKEPDREGYDRASHIFESYYQKELPSLDQLKTGGIVGKAKITDVVTRHPSVWFEGPYGFVIEMAHVVPFRECPGQLKFFDPEFPEEERPDPEPAERRPW